MVIFGTKIAPLSGLFAHAKVICEPELVMNSVAIPPVYKRLSTIPTRSARKCCVLNTSADSKLPVRREVLGNVDVK